MAFGIQPSSWSSRRWLFGRRTTRRNPALPRSISRSCYNPFLASSTGTMIAKLPPHDVPHMVGKTYCSCCSHSLSVDKDDFSTSSFQRQHHAPFTTKVERRHRSEITLKVFAGLSFLIIGTNMAVLIYFHCLPSSKRIITPYLFPPPSLRVPGPLPTLPNPNSWAQKYLPTTHLTLARYLLKAPRKVFRYLHLTSKRAWSRWSSQRADQSLPKTLIRSTPAALSPQGPKKPTSEFFLERDVSSLSFTIHFLPPGFLPRGLPSRSSLVYLPIWQESVRLTRTKSHDSPSQPLPPRFPPPRSARSGKPVSVFPSPHVLPRRRLFRAPSQHQAFSRKHSCTYLTIHFSADPQLSFPLSSPPFFQHPSYLPTYLPRYLSTSAICARGRGFLGHKISVKLHQPTFQVRFFFPLTYLLSGILVTHPLPGCLLLPTLLDPNIPRACNCTASQIQSRGHTPLLLSQRAALLAVPSLRLCNEHPLTSCLLTDHHLTLRLPSQ